MDVVIVDGKQQRHSSPRFEKVTRSFLCGLETADSPRSVCAVLTHNDIAGLESTIDLTYKIASKRLLDIFFDQYHLMDHLQAVKRYILLSAGDFAELLHRNLR